MPPEPSSQPPIEPYNPYPAKPDASTLAATQKGSKLRSHLALSTLAGIFVVVGILVLSTLFVQSEVDAQATKALRKALGTSSAGADLKFSKVKVSLLRQRLNILGLQFTLKSSGEVVAIDSVSLGGVDWETLQQILTTRKAIIPKTFNIQFDGVHVPTTVIGAQGQEFLRSLNYDALKLSSFLQVSRDPDRKTFDLENLEVEMENLGRLNVSFSLGNLTLPSAQQIAEIKKDPKRFLSEAGDITKLTVRGFELSFHDDSLVERATKAFVSMGEAPPIALVDLAIDANTPGTHKRGVANTQAGTDFTLPALATLRKFLAKPRSITLASRPRRPIPVVSLLDDSAGGSINELAHRLSLKVE